LILKNAQATPMQWEKWRKARKSEDENVISGKKTTTEEDGKEIPERPFTEEKCRKMESSDQWHVVKLGAEVHSH